MDCMSWGEKMATHRCRGDPEGFVLQLLDHVSLDLGGGERVVDAAVLHPHARLFGAGPETVND